MPVRIVPAKLLVEAGLPPGAPSAQPRALFEHFVTLLGRLDIRLQPQQRPVIAAALVRYVYAWNAFCDWREVRNLAASILSELRPKVARRLSTDAAKRGSLIARLERLCETPLYVRRGPPLSEPSYAEREIRGFISKLSSPSASLPEDARDFGLWLREQSDYRVGPEASVFGDVPGADGFIAPGKRRPQEKEAAKLFALVLPALLRMAYGTKQNAVEDAYTIACRAFAAVPAAVPHYEVFRAARWRNAEVPALASELGRAAIWLTLEEHARQFAAS